MDWLQLWQWPGWNAVGALGQLAGAIGTAAAVIVALKQVRDASAIRVVVKASIGLISHGGHVSDTMVFFSATNDAHRPVKLTSAGLILPNGKTMTFPYQLGTVLPITLQESDQVQFHVDASAVADTLAKEGYRGKVKLRVYFSDSRDYRHWCRFRFNVDYWLRGE